MRVRLLNYVILSLALCLGQLVTLAHLIGHLKLDSPHHDHAGHHASAHSHSSPLVDFRTKPTADKSDSVLAECGVYHVFAGMLGIGSSYSANVSEHASCEVRAKLPKQLVVTQANEWHLIRGPPTNS
jgi:hypothetical protein